jgi:PGF-pre-PGF domain-containing protein/PGF-CTERM protein
VSTTPDPLERVIAFDGASAAATFSTVDIDQPLVVNLNRTAPTPDGGVTQVRLTSPENAIAVQVTVEQAATPAGDTPPTDRPATTLSYTRVTVENLENASRTSGELQFTVAADRLDSLDATPDDVQMYRYHDGAWTAIETSHVEADQYRATTPGFSWFAVGIAQTDDSAPTNETDSSDQSGSDTAESNTSDSDSDAEGESDSATDSESADTESTDGSIPGFTGVAAVIALVIAAAVATRR